MTEAEQQHRRGLEKLGLNPVLGPKVHLTGGGVIHTAEWPDLRTDPAFAWRVAEAFATRYEVSFVRSMFEAGVVGSLADRLYAAVCELGASDET